ncbi:peptidase [candidate division KSB1 bacterium]|nr:zinc metallopeptidase [bacterium]RKY78442.1 MAG: peptidase [candidate division KSB1 bacterium]HDI51123.1 zinc metallopeptidase [Bacteroidota bacterium]RKY80631.1 MAG: peptidase [candidate division KSB1 bacterium]RKY85152.1 MAG: peptidase [candidate division KSB1 bacterium]
MPFFFYDPTMLLLIPAFILALYAQFKVKSTYDRFSKIPSAWGRSGASVARDILNHNGLHDVEIEETHGVLSDHYDPRVRKLRLSSQNFRSSSIAAISVAAHEVGHAIQHKTGYAPLQVRHAILPVVGLGSNLAFPLFFIGLIFSSPQLMDIGILLFTGVVLFQLVTLPVEFNASHRALQQLESGEYLHRDEISGAREVLKAAALTYVAATAMALINLLRLILIARSRD